MFFFPCVDAAFNLDLGGEIEVTMFLRLIQLQSLFLVKYHRKVTWKWTSGDHIVQSSAKIPTLLLSVMALFN